MPRMAKRKKQDGEPVPDRERRSDHVAVLVRLPVRLAEAFTAYRTSQRPPPTATAIMLLALEEFLVREGVYQPDDPPPT